MRQKFGQRASRLWQTPLFVHEGSLSCTGREHGAILGPSMCVGTGNPWVRGFLEGWCWYPHSPGLVRRWWAWFCMVCLGLPFPLALVPPARQGFSTYKEQSRSGDAPTQDGKGWNLTGLPGPSEEEKRKSWGTDTKAEGQQPGCLLDRPFRGCLGGPGWWFLHRVLGRGAVGPQCTSCWGAACSCPRLTRFHFLSAGR